MDLKQGAGDADNTGDAPPASSERTRDSRAPPRGWVPVRTPAYRATPPLQGVTTPSRSTLLGHTGVLQQPGSPGQSLYPPDTTSAAAMAAAARASGWRQVLFPPTQHGFGMPTAVYPHQRYHAFPPTPGGPAWFSPGGPVVPMVQVGIAAAEAGAAAPSALGGHTEGRQQESSAHHQNRATLVQQKPPIWASGHDERVLVTDPDTGSPILIKPVTTKQSKEHRDKLKSQGKRIYECPFCDHIFSCSSNLNRHKRVHTGDKPFLCSHCGTPFANSSNRNKHERKCDAGPGDPNSGVHVAALLEGPTRSSSTPESSALDARLREERSIAAGRRGSAPSVLVDTVPAGRVSEAMNVDLPERPQSVCRSVATQTDHDTPHKSFD
eukprot:m.69765 g.69765  ORF g.69765 m.69765 type:complete len:380 (-) comp9979_c0_seq3:35-1174(-)